jgi:hypothetical protein
VEIDIESDEEDDEDYNWQDREDNLYDSKLDDVNEVIYFRDALTQMQT